MDKKYVDIHKVKMFWFPNEHQAASSHSHTQTQQYAWSPAAVSQGHLLLLVAAHNAAACFQQCRCARIKAALSYTLNNLTVTLHLDSQTTSIFCNRNCISRGFELSSKDSTELYLNVSVWAFPHYHSYLSKCLKSLWKILLGPYNDFPLLTFASWVPPSLCQSFYKTKLPENI